MSGNLMPEKVEDAIKRLKRSKTTKLSIATIAEKAGIARRTIYNRPELKERCLQAMEIQSEQIKGTEEDEEDSVKHKRKTITEKYAEKQKELNIAKESNAKLLENNRQLVIEKQTLMARIEMLESRVQQLRYSKVKPLTK